MNQDKPQFVFMTCKPGAETALKQEVMRGQPEWRLAFSRPGFVTFKVTPNVEEHAKLDEQQLASQPWVLARTHGVSLGKVVGEELAKLVREVWQLAGDAQYGDVHVWERDARPSDDDESTLLVSPLSTEIEQAIRAAAPESSASLREPPGEKRRPAARNSRVLDVVIVEPNQWWIGTHLTVSPQQRWPGGAIPVRTPEHAVSRAYTKMAEAIAWSGLPIERDDECVELGCAPGGASQALLDRGLFVTGIDPAEVEPILLKHPRFRHLRKRSKEVRRSEYLGVRWLAADMNLAPNYTLDAVEAVVAHLGVHIRGMVLTLKLADWTHADRLDEFAARVRGWGYRDVRMRQLASGGQEICLVALRRKELRRIGRKKKSASKQGPRQASGAAQSSAQLRDDPPHPTLSGPHFGG
jgi:23S rRNA (cytidine2498-2'-O)-methyltransferase